MEVHLIDGTYELFRHFYALPSAKDSEGREVAAVRGVLGSLLGMMRVGTTYIGVATDHVIESFRNRMWPEYKTGQGVEPQLLAQFPLLEETLRALGVVVWAMEEYEADDALASAAFLAQKDVRVKRVVISTPDKDLAQCILGTRVVQLDRRRRLERDEQGVIQKFRVKPSSIPDYLALVGDAADGYPGLPGWGAKSASAVLSRFGRLEAIPSDARDWQVNVSNQKSLSEVLNSKRCEMAPHRTVRRVENTADRSKSFFMTLSFQLLYPR
jgi:5'-3' exonuclease